MSLIPLLKLVVPRPLRQDSAPTIHGPVGAGEGYDETRRLATQRVLRFAHRGYDRELDYAWGYDDDATEIAIFVVGTQLPHDLLTHLSARFVG